MSFRIKKPNTITTSNSTSNPNSIPSAIKPTANLPPKYKLDNSSLSSNSFFSNKKFPVKLNNPNEDTKEEFFTVGDDIIVYDKENGIWKIKK